MSLALTMLDHAGPPRPGSARRSRGRGGDQVPELASISRELAYNDYQNSETSRGEPPDRNAIIVLDKPWPAAGD
jgi:hypothetical protein